MSWRLLTAFSSLTGFPKLLRECWSNNVFHFFIGYKLWESHRLETPVLERAHKQYFFFGQVSRHVRSLLSQGKVKKKKWNLWNLKKKCWILISGLTCGYSYVVVWCRDALCAGLDLFPAVTPWRCHPMAGDAISVKLSAEPSVSFTPPRNAALCWANNSRLYS